MLTRARVVVSVNTGVMHLAAILGAPTVSINGPNRNGRWGPIGPRALGVEAPGEGCGYLHLGFNFDNQPTDCMERITVKAIAEAARNSHPHNTLILSALVNLHCAHPGNIIYSQGPNLHGKHAQRPQALARPLPRRHARA